MTIVRFTIPARAQLRKARAWWTENRPKNPYLLHDELAAAILLLRATPHAGERFRAEFRRFLLKRTGYFLYYLYDQAADMVEIHAVRSGRRRRGPRLR
ncbi:MAG: type II toxin-antitoxin system RelE/ParE family toxin [Myxococcota bacterium]